MKLLLAAVLAASAQYESWIVWWDADSLPEFTAHQERLDEVVIFGWRFGTDGRLQPGAAATTTALAAAKASGKRVYVSALNDRLVSGAPVILKDPAIVHDILTDPARRAAHLDELAALADRADGLEMDYENLWAIDRDAYTAFIRDLGARLRPRGKSLAVVVQQKRSNVIRNGAGAMDWAALAQHVDHVKIMAYNQHGEGGSAGPVASPDWVEQIVTFGLTMIPRDKLVVILPLHGFVWPQGGRGRSIEHDAAIALARRHGASIERDPQGSPHFTYVENGVRHDVWFEDELSVISKIRRLHNLGVHEIALWRLGTGDPAIWQALPKTATRD